ncbi:MULTISPECIES: toxin co-regulated pilus biosynthesis Q family protein [Achromobacter]|uniref:Toxin co-regulated pilus biosynthesis Q family protein n=1 Tax=Achromobacter marplatensis TaxID=470868 RepID=A0AA42W9T4_9BURK|nr:toxin co-regulated pilus biosynthesis Q family protein [Achromobacter marplatensis]MDH2051210.1 toxin co-regulated pilus biosynthesis Q family protein [Achromobacter marplatensis]
MQAPLLAAVVSAACLLSACGFVPPAPPTPPDSGRILINHADPRTVLPGKSPTALASADIPPIPVPEAPPKLESPASPASATSPMASNAAAAAPGASTTATPAPAAETTAQTTEASTSPQQVAAAPGPVITVEVASAEPVAEPEIVEPPKQIWRISPQDGTVRQALVRWASDANWTFGPDQWELNFDIPIQAPAEFEEASFREATQALSQAVAMSESPIRPCFYGNRVLRMLPFTRSCNRSPAPQS